MTPRAIANSEALGVTGRSGNGKASRCQDSYLEPDVFHILNSTFLLLMSGDMSNRRSLQITEVGRHGVDLRPGQAVGNRRHDERCV